MYYRGMMDGWHGDEYECTGHCGSCDSCFELMEAKGDSDYAEWEYEQLSNE